MSDTHIIGETNVADQDELPHEELFRKARPRLLIMARIAGVPEQDSEDLVQDVCTAAQTELRAGRFPARSSFAAWLQGIAKNKIKEHWRRKQRTDQRLVPAVVIASGGEEISLIDSCLIKQPDREIILTVRQIVRQLPVRERQVLLLKYVAHLTLQEIAQKLGQPQTTIWRLLSQARQHFAENFLNFAGRSND